MKIKQIDHLVLTVKNIDITIDFYVNILNMEKEIFNENRVALKFGNQKINLHQLNTEVTPKAKYPTLGSCDLCFIVETSLEKVYQELIAKDIKIIEGIVNRTGANGKIKSLYINDPDGNLIELSNYEITKKVYIK
jgi:catechol 2,3-dioxygenase-like lactoylglutathione lyase family enzyme